MKAFENLELWWVTGAQLLYGGDAVVAVDKHSKEMVEGLNNSGNIPVKVVYKGTANSSKEVEAVMKEANNDSLDAHFLSRQDVDSRIAAVEETALALPHPVQRRNSLGHYGHGLHEPQPECPR